MNPYFCRNCGTKIDRYAYRNKVFCSGKCRVQYHRDTMKHIKKYLLCYVKGVTGGEKYSDTK